MQGARLSDMAEISKTLDDGLRVLMELAEFGPLTATELGRRLGLHRTVAYRLLVTLHQRGFVARREDGYLPGAVLLEIAQQVQPVLRVAASRVIKELRDEIEETVILSVIDGDDAMVVDESVAASRELLRVVHGIGARGPLYLGAGGLVLLAHLPSSEAERIIRRSQYPDRVRSALESVRVLGYAASHDELKQGVHGLAVPVFDAAQRPLASLAILVPATRSSTLFDHIKPLRTAAQRIGEALQLRSVLGRDTAASEAPGS